MSDQISEVRLALLEQRVDRLEETVENNQKYVKETLDKVSDKLDVIVDTQARQKSFIGGILFTFSALTAAIAFARDYFKPLLGLFK